MPTYDYFCDANGQTVEVKHKINEGLATWGELCRLTKTAPGDTPLDAPVRKLIGGSAVIHSSSLSNPEPACGTGACCPGGVCGLNE